MEGLGTGKVDDKLARVSESIVDDQCRSAGLSIPFAFGVGRRVDSG